MNHINLIRRIGAASDNAGKLYLSISNKFFCLLTNWSTSIMSTRQGIGTIPFPSTLADTNPAVSDPSENYVKSATQVDSPTATNLSTIPRPISGTLSGQIERTSPSLSIVRGEVYDRFVARVLARLSEAEWNAPLAARDDIRVAWITVLKAEEGHPTPFAQAFFQYFGVSPEKMIPFLSARADLDRIYAQSQAAWLEKYLPFRPHDGWRETFARIQAEIEEQALPPKKPAASAPVPKVKRRAA